jgi:hypothetical protein
VITDVLIIQAMLVVVSYVTHRVWMSPQVSEAIMARIGPCLHCGAPLQSANITCVICGRLLRSGVIAGAVAILIVLGVAFVEVHLRELLEWLLRHTG